MDFESYGQNETLISSIHNIIKVGSQDLNFFFIFKAN
jgi:hypothetical protein